MQMAILSRLGYRLQCFVFSVKRSIEDVIGIAMVSAMDFGAEGQGVEPSVLAHRSELLRLLAATSDAPPQ
jgi:hypothetical protein